MAKVLVVGSGGREHALCWKLAESKNVTKIFCAPGNGGTAQNAKTENIDISAADFAALKNFALQEAVDLVVIGPDNALADGVVDYLSASGLRVFGPTKAAARLESSKAFGKDFMQKASIPTARYMVADNFVQACELVREHPFLRVVKVDGLALGKGVFVCDSEEEALDALAKIFRENRFGQSGKKVVLEERLQGEELSLLCFCDGRKLVPMPAAQDHKRRFDGDKGPNTGGMGAYSPIDLYHRAADSIEEQVLRPLRDALVNQLIEFRGLLFLGILVTTVATEAQAKAYQPYVLEFNARFGDPETQVLLPLLDGDLYSILLQCSLGKLNESEISWHRKAACTVVLAAKSYPESGSKGEAISIGKNLDPNVIVFHAGTQLNNGQLLSNGGRILAVTGIGANLEQALNYAYEAVGEISFPGMDYRRDIARRSTAGCH